MCHFISRLHTFLLGICFVGFSALPGAAQTLIQASSVVPAPYTNDTNNATLAVDNSQQTAAVLLPATLDPAELRVGFGSMIPQGQRGVILLKGANGGLLDLSLIGSLTIRTFRSTNLDNTIQSIPVNSSSVALALLPGSTDITQVTFVATQPFDQVELEANVLARAATSISVFAVYATVAPLPISLTAFSGKATAAGVALNWETASEQHNDHFVVERAEGTPETFRALRVVKGAGNSTQQHQYQFMDAQPSGLCYYRLRQVDTDGTETFSPVVAVQAELLSNLLAYPTLATETLTIVGARGSQLVILDHLGRPMRVANISDSQEPQLDVRDLPGGVYFLRDAATGQRTRFVKASAQ